MEINKLTIIFDSHKQKNHLLNTIILPYKNFMEGFFSVDIREKNKLKGYNIEFINGHTFEFASKEFIGEIYYNKYAIKKDTLNEISNSLSRYIEIKNKIILLEVGTIFISDKLYLSNLIKLLSSDKKMIIFSPRQKEIITTIRKLDDIFICELSKKSLQTIKKIVDKWLGETVAKIELV